jgi:hypothetical protein
MEYTNLTQYETAKQAEIRTQETTENNDSFQETLKTLKIPEQGSQNTELESYTSIPSLQEALGESRMEVAQRIPMVGQCNNSLRSRRGHPCSFPKSLGGLPNYSLTKWCQINLGNDGYSGRRDGSDVLCEAPIMKPSGYGENPIDIQHSRRSLSQVCQSLKSEPNAYWHNRSQVCAKPREYYTFYTK